MGKHNSHRKVGNLFESDDLNRISCVFFLARNLIRTGPSGLMLPMNQLTLIQLGNLH